MYVYLEFGIKTKSSGPSFPLGTIKGLKSKKKMLAQFEWSKNEETSLKEIVFSLSKKIW
jgi:hypothetical protein